ncbi:MAG: hypothetical protein ABSC94_04690 [Polyangiaceae bacterium]|jgi:hypothetical protein
MKGEPRPPSVSAFVIRRPERVRAAGGQVGAGGDLAGVARQERAQARFATVLADIALSRELECSRADDGSLQVALGDDRILVVRGRRATRSHVEGITAWLKTPGEMIWRESFELEVVNDENVWRMEHIALLTYSDGELAGALLGRTAV